MNFVNSGRRVDWLAWWQLLRLSNVFTAASNVIAGYLLAGGSWRPFLPLGLLIVTSCCLYSAGMVLNDVFDAELDAQQRPERPIPSGRVKRGSAFRFGLALLALSLVAATLVSGLAGHIKPLAVAVTLAVVIITYDYWAKPTYLGPLVMGGCRTLNVLLGASASGSWLNTPAVLFYAAVIGIYTVGLTWLARHEVTHARLADILGGALLIFASLVAVTYLPWLVTDPQLTPLAWFIFCGLLWSRAGQLLWGPLTTDSPMKVRAAVGGLIALFIPVDAAASGIAAGWLLALIVLCLFVPMKLISLWTSPT